MERHEEIIKSYNKVLIAKLSPENGCFVEEGAILTILPRKITKMKDHINHHFVDSLDKKTKSKYGWVKTVEPFTIDEFIKKYGSKSQTPEEVAHVKKMLDSINLLTDDVPVAATYSERGIENKRMEFTVHRVFFR